MGGSSLGARAIYDFIKPNIRKNFYFYDNLDAKNKLLKRRKNSLSIIISKMMQSAMYLRMSSSGSRHGGQPLAPRRYFWDLLEPAGAFLRGIGGKRGRGAPQPLPGALFFCRTHILGPAPKKEVEQR